MFEEVKEMIDATVYPNGNGEVTAQNINLAMQGIVDATEEKIAEVEEKVADIEENGTGGSGALKVWINEIFGTENTEEQIAENIATFEALAREEDHVVHLMVVMDEGDMHCFAAITPLTQQMMVSADGTKIVEFDIETYGDKAFVTLHSDGSISIEPYTADTTASNGPLRVWLNDVNTPEQTEENVATYNALMQDVNKSAILMYTDGTMTQSFSPVTTVAVNEPTPMVQFCVITGMIGGEVEFAPCFLFADGSVTIE